MAIIEILKRRKKKPVAYLKLYKLRSSCKKVCNPPQPYALVSFFFLLLELKKKGLTFIHLLAIYFLLIKF